MKASLTKELKRIVGLIALSLVVVLMLGSLWPLVAALLCYISWSTWQLFSLYSWLAREDGSEPPECSGLWGEFYNRLYHLIRKEQRAQQDLQSILKRGQQSVNALEDVVILIDQRGQLEYWNHAAERLIGFRAPDLGQPLTNLLRHPHFIDFLAKGDFREHLEIPSPLDSNRILQFRVTEFGIGEQLIMARDVTRLHRLEQMRKDFVANVSHELKTPLTVLKGYLETLLDSLPEEQVRLRRALSQMQGQSNRMEALVSDLLLLARLEGTDTEQGTERIRVGSMLQRMRENAQLIAEGKGHQISLQVAPDDALIFGNLAELESAFGNLINNAVKYTPAGGLIEIRWWQDEQGGHFSVTDNGPGIDPYHLPRLTERFYRPDDSRVTQTGGTGLGLAIVKHVLIRHNGRLAINSQVGKGSTFSCHFPPSRLLSSTGTASRLRS